MGTLSKRPCSHNCTTINESRRLEPDAHMQQAAWRVYGQRSKCAVLIEDRDFYSKVSRSYIEFGL